MRVWDTFVVDMNNFSQAVTYAADNDVEVVEGAVGGLLNSRFARQAFEYAYEKGVLMTIVSSDLNTANHNFPTTYDESLMVQGTVADVNGLGADPPAAFVGELNALLAPALQPLGIAGIPVGTTIPIGTWFRNSGTTQYGGHAHVAMPGTTGSEATGQASGAAGLIASFGRERIAAGGIAGPSSLQPNEIKQLMTLTAEDVVAANTDPALGATGAVAALPPDPAQPGWDQHFGYGRPDLGLALERIDEGKIPPQALITSPDWFSPLNVEQSDEVEIEARLSAPRAGVVAGSRFQWELRWAPGIEPALADFDSPSRLIASGSGASEIEATLGALDLEAVRAALDDRTIVCPNPTGGAVVLSGGSTCDPTAPGKGPGDVDPNEPAFTVKLEVTDTDGNVAEDRKVLFAYRDSTLHEGSPRPVGREAGAEPGIADSGGEASQRMYDLNGDNSLELIEASSSGELAVFESDGTALQSFNAGQPVETRPYANVHRNAPSYDRVEPPREALRTPAIGDIDGDLEPEIVDSAGEHVYAWERDGSVVDGFPVRLDPSFSEPADRTRTNHVKRGFIASPTLGDLDRDGALEIIIPGLDQRLYGWDGGGTPLPGFPVYLRERDPDGDPVPCSGDIECAESITTAALGDIAGDSKPEIVVSTNEFDDNPAAAQTPGGGDVSGALGNLVTNLAAQALGGSGRIYAVNTDGEILPGWPVKPNGIVPDALPLIGPGLEQALGNVDADPALEVIGAISTGELTATNGDGSSAATYPSTPSAGESPNGVKVLNFFEYPILAELDGAFPGPEVAKSGITLPGLLNVGVLTGLNAPYNHVVQAWGRDPGASNPVSLPAYPQAVEDYQLLSSPSAADVSDAPGTEIISGSGLYLIRNLNSTGQEGTGWPKFTGGWNFAVPAVGDVDRDGKLEVSAITREGFSFLWDTDSPACGTNDEWWTSRHDEWSSGAYGTDSRPPGTPEDIVATPGAGGGFDLSWSAPGDDWLCGQAARYRVLVADDPIEHPRDGEVAAEEDAVAASAETQTAALSQAEVGTSRHLAVLYRDDAGNWGQLATISLRDTGSGASSGAGGAVGATPGDGPAPAGEADGSVGRRCSAVISGTDGRDRLRGNDGSERIRGLADDDRIRALGGDDCVNGGTGDDSVRGGDGADRLGGDEGRDRLRGDADNDRITGGDGRDRIDGGQGRDRVRANGDRERDRVDCGPGRDIATVDENDKVKHCEEIRR
jgi:hypothetical protein